MVDQDLSGDDLKLVRFKILYTKRDDESILHHGEKLVNYSTTLNDFGGLVTCEWVEKNPGKVKHEDARYLRTFVEVLARYPKQEKEYDREQVEVLRDIRNAIGGSGAHV